MMHRGPRNQFQPLEGTTVPHTARTRGRDTPTLNRVARWETKVLSVVGDAWDPHRQDMAREWLLWGHRTAVLWPFELSLSTVRLILWRIILGRRGPTLVH